MNATTLCSQITVSTEHAWHVLMDGQSLQSVFKAEPSFAIEVSNHLVSFFTRFIYDLSYDSLLCVNL